MTTLSESQIGLLRQVAAGTDGAIDAPTGGRNTAASLIKRGLLISVPQADGPSRLMITEAGRLEVPEPRQAPAVKGKLGVLVDLLQRPEGATIDDMMIATGWQAHSVRGAISGAIKKDRGIEVLSEKTETGRIYRIPAEATA